MRMLAVFEKGERIRHIGHLDIQRSVQRGLRRSGGSEGCFRSTALASESCISGGMALFIFRRNSSPLTSSAIVTSMISRFPQAPVLSALANVTRI